MAERADVIIIGAGVIGAATAFELAKRGHRTLSLDRNAEPGHYWRDWEDYLGVRDERGLAPFRETGCLVMKTKATNSGSSL